MSNVQPTPVFCGVWRTDSAAIRFNADGTFETLHAPSSGTYKLLRDTEWSRWPVESCTGFVLLMLFKPSAGGIDGGSLYLIDEYAPDRAVIRTHRPGKGGEALTIFSDSATNC